MSAPTVGDLLAPTGLPAFLDRPVDEVLADLGVKGLDLGGLGLEPGAHGGGQSLPALPTSIGIDDLPALPALDPMALLKPVTDLLSAFGTGKLSSAQGGDPATSLQGIAETLQTGMSTVSAVLRAVDGLWSGQGGTAAATKSATAAANSGALATQGTAMSVDVDAALAIVGAGLASLQGVVVKTAGLIATTMPAIMTPPGQLAALGFAAEGLAEGAAVVAATRAQLTAPTAAMTAHGAKVPVTAAPTGTVSPLATAANALDAAAPLVSAGTQVATGLLSVSGLSGHTTTTPTTTTPTTTTPTTTGTPATTRTPSLTSSAAPGTQAAARPGDTGGVPKTDAASTHLAAARGGAGTVSVTPVEPQVTLSGRPLSVDPAGASTQSPAAPPSGWGRGAGAEALTPLAQTGSAGPAPRGTSATESRTVTTPVAASAADAAPTVLGATPAPAVTVDVGFRLAVQADGLVTS
ncbi:MAG: hypothetical protein QM658_14790 [Gordonia sp. (in: high G+C Gram-positive bacteria)]